MNKQITQRKFREEFFDLTTDDINNLDDKNLFKFIRSHNVKHIPNERKFKYSFFLYLVKNDLINKFCVPEDIIREKEKLKEVLKIKQNHFLYEYDNFDELFNKYYADKINDLLDFLIIEPAIVEYYKSDFLKTHINKIIEIVKENNITMRSYYFPSDFKEGNPDLVQLIEENFPVEKTIFRDNSDDQKECFEKNLKNIEKLPQQEQDLLKILSEDYDKNGENSIFHKFFKVSHSYHIEEGFLGYYAGFLTAVSEFDTANESYAMSEEGIFVGEFDWSYCHMLYWYNGAYYVIDEDGNNYIFLNSLADIPAYLYSSSKEYLEDDEENEEALEYIEQDFEELFQFLKKIGINKTIEGLQDYNIAKQIPFKVTERHMELVQQNLAEFNNLISKEDFKNILNFEKIEIPQYTIKEFERGVYFTGELENSPYQNDPYFEAAYSCNGRYFAVTQLGLVYEIVEKEYIPFVKNVFHIPVRLSLEDTNNIFFDLKDFQYENYVSNLDIPVYMYYLLESELDIIFSSLINQDDE